MNYNGTRLAFAGLGRVLTVSVAPGLDITPLWNAIVILMPGWFLRETGAPGETDISISGTNSDFTIQAESWDGGFSKAAHANEAANALAGMLIDGMLAHGQAAFCLHAAAAEIGDRAVLFVGASEAGKSTMALRLAARGCRHLADDRIVLVRDAAPYRVATLGLAAKARKPLPPGEDLARLAETYWFIEDDEVVYLLLDEDATGERAAFTGDLMHHPVQVRHPEWSTCFCWDLEMSSATRKKYVDGFTDSGTLILPAHFAGNSAGHIVRAGDTSAFNFLPD